MRRPSLLLALLAGVALATIAGAQSAGVPAAVDHLLEGFASDSCVRRWQAIEEYVDRMIGRVDTYEEPGEDVSERLRERARSAAPRVVRKVRDVTAYTDEFKAAYEQLAKLAATGNRSDSDRDVWRKQLEPLTKALDDSSATYLVRRLAASVIAGSARKSETARAEGWGRPVPRLLESNDPTARLVASIQAAQGNLLWEQAPTKGRVVPELIRGLDADQFGARYDSARSLLEVSGRPVERFCVDPTDSAVDRAGAVRTWRAWWAQNKARISGDRIPQ